MLTVVILDNQEPKVIQLTYENLHRELKVIANSELIVAGNWLDSLGDIKNNYVCFVEADCLVNSGYFSSQLGLFKKSPARKLAMLSSAIGVNNWANRFYGYSLGNNFSEGIIPNKEKKSTSVYPVQIGYVPGSVMRVSMLKEALQELGLGNNVHLDLIKFSTDLSLAFWRQADGNRVHINPNTTYVTTEDYVNDIGKVGAEAKDLVDMFRRELI